MVINLARCAGPIFKPRRRENSKYRINKPSDNQFINSVPKRRSNSSSPTKRSSSRSPQKTPASVSLAMDELSMPNLQFDSQNTQKMIAAFQSQAEIRGSCCTITDVGRGWCGNMVVGPGLHACHMAAQTQYDLYPPKESEDEDEEDEDEFVSTEFVPPATTQKVA